MFQEALLNSCPKRPTRSSAPVQVRSANARRGRIPLSAGGSSSRTTMNVTAAIAGCTRPTPRHTATTLPKGLSLKAERTVTLSFSSRVGSMKTSNTLPISWMLSAFVCPQRRSSGGFLYPMESQHSVPLTPCGTGRMSSWRAGDGAVFCNLMSDRRVE